MEAELDGGEEGGVKNDGEDDETRKLLQKDLVVDRFTRAELHFRKVDRGSFLPPSSSGCIITPVIITPIVLFVCKSIFGVV